MNHFTIGLYIHREKICLEHLLGWICAHYKCCYYYYYYYYNLFGVRVKRGIRKMSNIELKFIFIFHPTPPPPHPPLCLIVLLLRVCCIEKVEVIQTKLCLNNNQFNNISIKLARILRFILFIFQRVGFLLPRIYIYIYI